jgi:hypothetical protein
MKFSPTQWLMSIVAVGIVTAAGSCLAAANTRINALEDRERAELERRGAVNVLIEIFRGDLAEIKADVKTIKEQQK